MILSAGAPVGAEVSVVRLRLARVQRVLEAQQGRLADGLHVLRVRAVERHPGATRQARAYCSARLGWGEGDCILKTPSPSCCCWDGPLTFFHRLERRAGTGGGIYIDEKNAENCGNWGNCRNCGNGGKNCRYQSPCGHRPVG